MAKVPVGFLFSPSSRFGAFAGRVFSTLWYPVLSLLLFVIGVALIAWVPISDLLVRANVVPMEQGLPIAKGEADLSFDAKSILASDFDVTAGLAYVVSDLSHEALEDNGIPASPTGIPKADEVAAMRFFRFALRNPDSGYFQLCASVGSPVGEAIPLRENLPFVPSVSGKLYLFVNDVPGFYGNNTGKVSLRVAPVRQQTGRD